MSDTSAHRPNGGALPAQVTWLSTPSAGDSGNQAFAPASSEAFVQVAAPQAHAEISAARMAEAVLTSTRWVANLERDAFRLGLGGCRILSADAHRCLVALTACPTCRFKGSSGGPCVRERQALKEAMRARAPRAKVSEVVCQPAGAGGCTFEIRRGRST
jgi:hypothetical protein